MENYRTEEISEPDATEEGRPRNFLRSIIDVLETLVLSVLLFVGINAISARIRVDGYSMEPTLQNDEYVLINKLAYKFGAPKRGEIIVFHYPRDPQQEFIKRIIGVAGDEVSVANGQVFVNGKLIQEPYIASPPAYQIYWKVPEDSVFVLGDNRNNSLDSHDWGPVPVGYVVGKALLVYWPPKEWGLIDAPTIASAAP